MNVEQNIRFALSVYSKYVKKKYTILGAVVSINKTASVLVLLRMFLTIFIDGLF